MTLEEQLKQLILDRYKSIREFAVSIDLPYSTIDSIFRRGVSNSSISNVVKICRELKISADELAEGRITPIYSRDLTHHIEIKEIIADTKERLLYGTELTLDGEPVNRNDIESIVNAMEIGVEMVNKNHNKNHNKNENFSKKIH